jgi:C4-dicarboxylate-specific signal transduction histidine kinase
MKRLNQNQNTRRRLKAAGGRRALRSELQEHRAAISEVLRVIACSSHDLQPIFDTILDNATRLCRANLGTLFLFEGAGVRLVARKGPPRYVQLFHEDVAIPIDPCTPLARLVRDRSPIHIADLRADQSYLQRAPLVVATVETASARTVFLGPMLKEDELIGTIGVFRSLVQPFSDKEIELITDFAAQATIALEITRRERQYRDAQIALAHANRVATMGQLTASIAHEMKQPVAAAVMEANAGLSWLTKQPPEIQEAKQSVGRVIKNVNRIVDVINWIHGLVKKDAPRTETVDINEAILEVLVLIRVEAVRNGVSVQTHLDEHVPRIQGDRVQLQQVVLNLIINAIQAMSDLSEGKRELHISSAMTDSEGVRVAVRDSGPGIGADNLQRPFEAFYTTKPNGMGMGLSICRSIIEDHGGRLWASEQVQQGALFQFTIPAK